MGARACRTSATNQSKSSPSFVKQRSSWAMANRPDSPKSPIGELTMSKTAAYYTHSPEYPPAHREVYHDHDDCKYGRTSSLNTSRAAPAARRGVRNVKSSVDARSG